MTPLLILTGCLGCFTIASYAYYLRNTEEPKDNGLYNFGAFIEGLWFNDGNKI